MIKFGRYTASDLIKKFSSPLYVYQEKILQENCQKIRKLALAEDFVIHYAAKANTNIALLQIIRKAGLGVEAISPSEVLQAELAGFCLQDILYSSNNISRETLTWIIQKDLNLCLDSLCQLANYWALGGKKPVCIRVNPVLGAGHHNRVVTAGKVKFGIDLTQVEQAFQLANEQNKIINGLSIHIGSLFLETDIFHQAVENLLVIADKYQTVNYVDFGGGFGIAYREKEQDFPIDNYTQQFQKTLLQWRKKNKRNVTFGIQPGRYVVGNSGVCLTQVQSIKQNRGISFIGVDLGFNFLLRPEFYGAYHKIEHSVPTTSNQKKFTIVGNVCESGDILGKNRLLPQDTEIGDILIVRDTGAYGFSMASNYNSMLRPAEVLITASGQAKLIRKRESFSDIVKNQLF